MARNFPVPTRSPKGVWMYDIAACESVARGIAIDAMQALGLDPDHWRTRDKLIFAICPRIDAALDAVSQSGEGAMLRSLEESSGASDQEAMGLVTQVVDGHVEMIIDRWSAKRGTT